MMMVTRFFFTLLISRDNERDIGSHESLVYGAVNHHQEYEDTVEDFLEKDADEIEKVGWRYLKTLNNILGVF
jgi:hypothetical protein